jgi:hypothetical protein
MGAEGERATALDRVRDILPALSRRQQLLQSATGLPARHALMVK